MTTIHDDHEYNILKKMHLDLFDQHKRACLAHSGYAELAARTAAKIEHIGPEAAQKPYKDKPTEMSWVQYAKHYNEMAEVTARSAADLLQRRNAVANVIGLWEKSKRKGRFARTVEFIRTLTAK